jgi:hypothetical protein
LCLQLQACTVDHHSNTKAAQLESAWGRFEIRGKLQMSLFKQHAASARHVAAVARMTGAQGVDPLSKAPSAGDFASVLGAVRAGKASHGEGIAGTSRRAKVRVRHTKIKCSPPMLSTILVQACPPIKLQQVLPFPGPLVDSTTTLSNGPRSSGSIRVYLRWLLGSKVRFKKMWLCFNIALLPFQGLGNEKKLSRWLGAWRSL